MKNRYFRSALGLGTSLTALFLLVRCSVPERDYALLGIDENGSSGANGGSGGNGGDDAGLGGLGGLSGTQAEPVPCSAGFNDAGIDEAVADDAGRDDAGTSDAGPAFAPCACVDGFVKAIDADGDGEGTRACSIAPGLDCDDGDGSVTHNGCGGCTALPNAVGADCLECGVYVCESPDTVACASKPGPVEDPDCRCLDALIIARDTDRDGEGTRLCEFNPGNDCNDGDGSFVTNECGGCDALPGTVGDPCNECGVYTCTSGTLACVPSPSAGTQCLNSNTRQSCVGTGFWGNNTICPYVCYQGNCEVCTPTPNTYRCVPIGGGSTQIEKCGYNSSSSIAWGSYRSCTPAQTCNANNGTCTSSLLLPRDLNFDVAPALHAGGVRWHDVLNTAQDSDYG